MPRFLCCNLLGAAVGGILPNCGEERRSSRFQIVSFGGDANLSRTDKEAVIRGNRTTEQQVRRMRREEEGEGEGEVLTTAIISTSLL